MQWIRAWLSPDVANKAVAIDGKTLRGSHDSDLLPIHLVSAFASEAGIVLGQIKTQEKSNEITAIPELLDWLDVRGATVTIDAMGCQKAIAGKIIDKGAIIFWLSKVTKAICMTMSVYILNTRTFHHSPVWR